MAGQELTDRIAAQAKAPEAGQRVVWDSIVRGYGLRITKAGAKSFVLNYRSQGIQRQLTIGSWPSWSGRQARSRAMELSREIDVGGDPMADPH